ncbi:protein DpdG [Scytonema sp. NUACC26]|uniref:protein DpdG n=1 Tax=Scytonema sp. NUACC26 TaxID=3140176 RepID=UPI0034DC9A9E
MSVLKEPLATPSRIRGIYRYLLQVEGQREKREVIEKILSPNELVKNAPFPRPMLSRSLNEMCKIKLLLEENEETFINPNLPEDARDPKIGDRLLPNTLANLFFASGSTDDRDFGNVCAWFLVQDIYEFHGTWKVVEREVTQQGVGELLKMSNNALFGQMDDWMCYMGLAWGHALDGRVTVPDPSLYIKRNLKDLFEEQVGTKILLQVFIDRLAKKCPLFETGQFRETIEEHIGYRQPNYLSTSTAFALFRLQDEGYIQLKRESDADLMILPKANNQVDDDGRMSHIIWEGKAV